MPSKRKQSTPPIIINKRRYKYVESNEGLCQKCAGFKDENICMNLPSCSDGGYFVEVAKKL
jgi:hypothetical protein